MKLRELTLTHYGPFRNAHFDLTTSQEKPIVLFTGNNGAGKTTTIEALRLAFHGRRGLNTALSDAEYTRLIQGRFHNSDYSKPASINLSLDFSESGDRHTLHLKRAWTMRGKQVDESLNCQLDGVTLSPDNATELLLHIFPGEVLSYFFFDAERIADLADWENDDDSKLFTSIDHLLGLNVAEQLERDLERVTLSTARDQTGANLSDLATSLAKLDTDMALSKETLKTAKVTLAAAARRHEKAQERLRAFGGIVADERGRLEACISRSSTRIANIETDLREEAAGFLPLLIAKGIVEQLRQDIDVAAQVEAGNAVAQAFGAKEEEIRAKLKRLFPELDTDSAVATVREAILPRPIALDHPPADLSLREISWMRSVLGNDLPRLKDRTEALLKDHALMQEELDQARACLQQSPKDDPVVEAALLELDTAQRELFTAETNLENAKIKYEDLEKRAFEMNEEIRRLRNTQFRDQRLQKRDILLTRLARAIPDYANQLRTKKQSVFSDLLLKALTMLWHKVGRIRNVDVNLLERTVRLTGAEGVINKSDLSAAEKQLFSLGFIFALAKLSTRTFPFAIDTPLGRLDRKHRRRLLLDFLPTASHQVILFSTDTEIVGTLYEECLPLISRHYELSEYNDNITDAVQFELAL